jgi:hypothetical protein
MVRCVRGIPVVAGLSLLVVALLFPAAALAQVGNIAGTVRDASGGVLPGVTVEVSSPQLIEGVRSTVADENGRYRIVSLPAGVYKVAFKLDGFSTLERTNVEVSSDATVPVNAAMAIGNVSEVVEVVGASVPLVDVQNARQRQVFTGDEVADLPTTRNLNDLIQLVPGIAIGAQGLFSAAGSTPMICSGGQGQGQFSGALSGCSPVLTDGFNAHASINDGASLNQGRIQVDGMSVQNLTASLFGGTNAGSSLVMDTANAQEIVFTLSGALGESETGGTTINIVPRTGGNSYAGNFFTAYSGDNFYGKNNKNYDSNFENRLIREYDVNGAFGGPILRDRLWFYATARQQDRESLLFGNYLNLNEGVFGANYQYDPANQLHQADRYQNASVRLTLQATRRDKFNIFWDEQYTCQNPCRGGGPAISIEGTGSQLTRPRNTNVSWTNPFTSRILLEAAVSNYTANADYSRHRFYENRYTDIPRINETGNTAVAPGSFISSIASGSINNATRSNNRNLGSRASLSYVTGSHNLKLGYQGQYVARYSDPYFNDLRMEYAYANAATNCTATKPTLGAVGTGGNWCGLRPDGTRNYDGRPESDPELGPALTTSQRIPVPNTVTTYIPSQIDEKTWSTSLYVQDQWTVRRFTLNGALRYDNAQSKFGETCVGPDLYKPDSYCLNDTSNPLWGGGTGTGVNYQDITPRIGVAWDVFGNGRTALKWSTGKYLSGSGASGIYIAANPASGGRTVSSLARTWRDLDGDRIVDCDLSIPVVAPAGALPGNGECGNPSGFGAANNSRRWGRSPNSLDELGLAVGLGTIYCSPNEIAQPSVRQEIRNYCQNYFDAGGKDLFNGWDVRQYEWQQSIGVQHQLLSRLSGEVTWNRRKGSNFTRSDLIGSGCDLYSSEAGGTVDSQQCMRDLLEYKSDTYDFYGIQAPLDPRLPGGGGYVVEGIPTVKPGADTSNTGVNAVTIVPDAFLDDVWTGVDTNFIWRAPNGLRVSGGTSTGRRNVDECRLLLNDPPNGVRLEEGGKTRVCENERPWQTNLRGTATYTVPWIDVLVSSTFSVRPGVERAANYEILVTDVVWGPHSQARVGTVTLGATNDSDVDTNLFDNATYGERITLFDLKLGKNIRFKGKRINIGVDVYNVFNSDAARGYCDTLANLDNGGQEGCSGTAAAGTLVEWGDVTDIVTPRYARFQLRMDF